MKTLWPTSVAELPLGLRRKPSLWSPTCASCHLTTECNLSFTTVSCDVAGKRGANTDLLPGTPKWREALAELGGLKIELPKASCWVDDLPTQVERVKRDRRLAGFDGPICISSEHAWGDGRLLTKEEVLKACGLSSPRFVVLAVTGRDRHLRKVKRSFASFREQLATADYDIVLGPALSVWDRALPSANTIATVQSARMSMTLAASGVPIVPALTWYQGFELTELINALQETEPHPVGWIDVQTARVGMRWAGLLDELSFLQESVPGLRVIAYGVHSPSRIADLKDRTDLICAISAYNYTYSATTAPGDLFYESFDP